MGCEPSSGTRRRDFLRPTRGISGLVRDKIRPADTKAPNLGCFARAGRVLSRVRGKPAEQGEKSHAPRPHLTPTRPPSPNVACNSIDDTSNFGISPLKFRAFRGATDCRHQGIACEIAKHQPRAAGEEGAGGAGGHGRASRSAVLTHQTATWPHWCGGRRRGRRARASHAQRQARPIGGRRGACGAWPGFETTRRAKLAARTTSGRAGHAAAGDLAGPQAPPNGEASELLVVLRVLVGLTAVGAAEGTDRSHLLRRQREGENVEVLALALRVTGLG